jgi:hypothetical protein
MDGWVALWEMLSCVDGVIGVPHTRHFMRLTGGLQAAYRRLA